MQEIGATEWLANLSVGYVVMGALVLTLVRLALVPPGSAFGRSAAELVESLLLAGVLVFLIIRPFLLQAFFIPSESMEPTLMGHDAGPDRALQSAYSQAVHDHIFVNKLIYRVGNPQRGDIIVFRATRGADIQGGEQHENILIKRLIGLPGEEIEVRSGRVWINGRALNEPYVTVPMQDPQRPEAVYATTRPLRLGPDQLFVMGDNRNNSNDSRFWGPLARDRVMGKAMFIFWPFSRLRVIR